MHRTYMYVSNYYDQSSSIKVNKCKTIVTFDIFPESKILDTGDILILSNLQKSWTIVCKEHLILNIQHAVYLTGLSCVNAPWWQVITYSQATSNSGGMPEVKDGFFTTYYAFNRIVLNVLMEKFDTQVDEDTLTQLTLVTYQAMIYQPSILYHHQKKHKKATVICSCAAFLCDILLIVTFIASFLKYCKTMQVMLAVFIIMNTSGIPPSKANPIGRTFPPLFTINLPEEDQIVKDLEDIVGMQTTIQVISFLVCAIVAIIILYQLFKWCHYTHSIVTYCFSFFPISRILRGTCRTDLFVEITNLTKGNTIWAHYTLTGYYPTSMRLSWQIPKENVHNTTSWCCFQTMHIDKD